MAKKKARPGRTLLAYILGVVVLYGLVGLTGVGADKGDSPWKPDLGLDLQGGTRITLKATNKPSKDNLEEARNIIDQRVNGSGIAEAEVTTQGSDLVVVEIPGDPRGQWHDRDPAARARRRGAGRARLPCVARTCRQHDVDERAQTRRAVEHGGLLEVGRKLPEKSGEQPDRERRRERHIGEHEPRASVEQADRAQHEVERRHD